MSSDMDVIFKTQGFERNELIEACDLVNQGGQLSIVLSEERLRETFFLVIAISQQKVVGVSCIKKYSVVAEIGYTAVCPSHRRQKIGQQMTMLLIKHALKNKITLLCGIVYKSNMANKGKLEKLGFFKASEFLSRSGKSILCWYCHPLSQSEKTATMIMKDFLVAREKSRATQEARL